MEPPHRNPHKFSQNKLNLIQFVIISFTKHYESLHMGIGHVMTHFSHFTRTLIQTHLLIHMQFHPQIQHDKHRRATFYH